jgi:pilus assembly protein Flp/PilA
MLNALTTRAYVALQTRKASQEGASAVEYGLILGILAIVIIAALIALGGGVQTTFEAATNALTGVGGGDGT